ncbi:MAG: hypothetical protein M1508_04055 [Nitrospirae bacterium]|nr:hypothetical protein [Nitrospirota bacterium]MCL5421773.1 hypothetical protein [Nitrospirota bacterium]
MAEKIRPNLNFTLLCDDVRQETGGKISLMGIFENVYATQFPAVHPRLATVNEWAEGRGEFDTTLRILSPDRKSILRETMARLKLGDARYKHRDISIHLNVEFREPGVYWIENYLDGVLVNSVPLQVILVKEKSFH